METKVEKELRRLKIYCFVVTLLCGVFVFTAFTQANRKQKFDEIDVGRINLIEKDGKLRMIISNSELSPDLILDGKPANARKEYRSPGMFFYNEKGDECGGLIFNSRVENGKAGAFSGLLFDQYNQDQTVAITYNEGNGTRSAGLVVWDRPENFSTLDFLKRNEAVEKMPEGAAKTEALKKFREDIKQGQWGGAQRVFVGKGRNKDAGIFLNDGKGKPRIRMIVTADGVPKLEFLDENGKAIYSLPEVPTKP
jgi:hypothetical protein